MQYDNYTSAFDLLFFGDADEQSCGSGGGATEPLGGTPRSAAAAYALGAQHLQQHLPHPHAELHAAQALQPLHFAPPPPHAASAQHPPAGAAGASGEVDEDDDDDDDSDSSGADDYGDDGGQEGGSGSGSHSGGRKRRAFAASSRVARQRRRDELDALRTENAQLRAERVANLRKIDTLEGHIEAEVGGTAGLIDLYENELLKEQIVLHSRFMLSFQQIIELAPKETSARAQIYKSGAEQARTIFLGLLAESQRAGSSWRKAQWPGGALPLPPGSQLKVDAWYRFADNLFESLESSSSELSSSSPGQHGGAQPAASGGGARSRGARGAGAAGSRPSADAAAAKAAVDPYQKPRLMMRIDVAYPAHLISTAQLAAVLRKLLVDQRAKLRLWGIPDDSCELAPLSDELKEEDIMLLHHRKQFPPPKPARDVVFLFDHHKTVLTRSTLAPPKNMAKPPPRKRNTAAKAGGVPAKRGRPHGAKGKKDRTLQFGEVPVAMLLRTSTTLLAGAKTVAELNTHRITSPVMAGAIVFEESQWVEDPDECDDEAGVEPERVAYTKVITLTSTPKEFSEKLAVEDWSRLLTRDGVLQPKFLHHLGLLLLNIVKDRAGAGAGACAGAETPHK